MSSFSTKEVPKTSNPKTFFPPIIASVGGLAIFLIIASTVLVSQPIGSTVRGYFYGVEDSKQIDPVSFNPFEDRGKSDGKVISQQGDSKSVDSHSDFESLASDRINSRNSTVEQPVGDQGKLNPTNREVISQQDDSESMDSQDGIELLKPKQVKSNNVTVEQPAPKLINEDSGDRSSLLSDNVQTGLEKNVEATTNLSRDSVSVPGCDLYDGKWIYDSTGPLYSNNSCPVLTQMQNCQGNGRPDKDYENWRWKPSQCDLLRFDPKKFLELMRGKTLAFIGDSVARNQMESMLCILWQVEEPKNRGNKKMQRFYFRSTSTMIVRIWSSWLVHQTPDPIDYAPAGVVKLHLDKPDEGFMQHIPTFDVIVLSSGHWFAKQSVYVLNNEIVGGQLWWPDKSKENKVNNIEAFGISVETILTSIGTHPNFTGLTIVRSFSPDHYEGGEWNTGGSCTGKTNPASDSELVENGFTNIMHEKQMTGFNRALKKKTNGSGLKLMDITKVFSYRHDGHPGPYRSPDPNKVTKRGPNGKPPPQDCLHWCMPGPVDTWNELVFEIIRRDFGQRESDSS